jgi:hypothetical protein
MKKHNYILATVIILLITNYISFAQPNNNKRPERIPFTEEQKQKIKEIKFEKWNATKDLKAELVKINSEIKIWEINNGLYNPQILRLIEKKAEIKTKLAKFNIDFRFARRDILSQEQKQNLQNKYKNCHKSCTPNKMHRNRGMHNMQHKQNGKKYSERNSRIKTGKKAYIDFLELDENQIKLFEAKLNEIKEYKLNKRQELKTQKINRQNKTLNNISKSEALNIATKLIANQKEKDLFILNIRKDLEQNLSSKQKQLFAMHNMRALRISKHKQKMQRPKHRQQMRR